MSKKKNKVRFGLKNAHYAKATFDEDGNVTYAKPVRLPGAVSLSMDPEGENENFYADDIVYFVINNNAGYEGDLELALIPEEFLKERTPTVYWPRMPTTPSSVLPCCSSSRATRRPSAMCCIAAVRPVLRWKARPRKMRRKSRPRNCP